jgi:hypothetical protein
MPTTDSPMAIKMREKAYDKSIMDNTLVASGTPHKTLNNTTDKSFSIERSLLLQDMNQIITKYSVNS